MDRWDLLIVGVAGYVAVLTLVRLMAARRNQLVEEVRHQIEQQQAQQLEAVQQKQQQEAADRGAA